MSAVARKRRAAGYAMVAVAAMGWGTWPLILRQAPMPSALQSAVLMTVVTLVSLPMMLRDRVRARPSAAQWAGVAWLGVGDALNTLLFFAAYQRTTVAVAVLTHYLAPIFIALAAPIVLRERAGARSFVAVAVAFTGLVLLLEPWGVTLGRSHVVGASLGAGSAVFYASNVLVNKRLVKAFSGSELMFFHGLVATPLLVALVPPAEYVAVEPRALAVALAGAVGPGALGGLLFVWGLRRIAASHASVLTLLEPFVAVVLAAAFLGQGVSALAVAGGALILAGGVLVVTGHATTADEALTDGVQSLP